MAVMYTPDTTANAKRKEKPKRYKNHFSLSLHHYLSRLYQKDFEFCFMTGFCFHTMFLLLRKYDIVRCRFFFDIVKRNIAEWNCENLYIAS